MRVRFEYETQDRNTDEDVLLTVEAEVDLGTPAILDRRPEYCEPGEPAIAEVDVLDPELRPLATEQIESRYQTTVEQLRREAIAVAREDRRY